MSFLRSLPPDGAARDAFLLGQIAEGRIDPPTWVQILAGSGVELEVSSDYLTIAGERVPMAPAVAQAAVDALDALLPTPAVVAAIERAGAAILPMPVWAPPAGQSRAAQTSSEIFAWAEEETQRRLVAHGITRRQLVAGHRKDVVLDATMPDGFVVIFGAEWADGRRLQPLYRGHGDWYEDYAHGVRAVRRRCRVWGQEALLDDVYGRPPFGPVARLRYPAPQGSFSSHKPSSPPSKSLRQGDRGPAVVELQRLLARAGWKLDDDGIFGPDTARCVYEYQAEHGLDHDGVAGPKTLAALRGEESPPSTQPDLVRIPLPLSDEERVRVFGYFEWQPAPRPDEPGAIRIFGDWVKKNITTIVVPQLVGVPGTVHGQVTCHRAAAPTILRFFEEVESAGKKDLILSFGGCWNPRLVRGGTSLSNHTWGTDFDLNAAWNARGTRGAPIGQRGTIVPLLPIAAACGLGWGGGWATPDPMHLGVREAAP